MIRRTNSNIYSDGKFVPFIPIEQFCSNGINGSNWTYSNISSKIKWPTKLRKRQPIKGARAGGPRRTRKNGPLTIISTSAPFCDQSDGSNSRYWQSDPRTPSKPITPFVLASWLIDCIQFYPLGRRLASYLPSRSIDYIWQDRVL